jgi:tripartite ATP-independent transporter DctM subunit
VDPLVALLVIIGGLFVLMASGLPIAFCFTLLNMVIVYIIWGGQTGLDQLMLGVFSSVATFNLLPVPLFIIMGDVMFYSGIVPRMMDALDKWLGRLPGRLGLLAVGTGTIIAATTGVSMASAAMLGKVLLPEMERRGYKKSMSLGPILGSGGLAAMIPPSVLGVLLGIIGNISVGKILVAIIVPGLLMAALYSAYIVTRCYFQPSIAPPYAVSLPPLRDRVLPTVYYVLPIGIIIFLVVGVIFFGIATPTEGAALGSVGTFLLAAVYRKLKWEMFKKTMLSSLHLTVMLLMIVTGAKCFSQVLTFTGAAGALVGFATALSLPPLLILIAMQIVLLIMGTFMDAVAILMITMPTYVPIIKALGYDPVWFAVIILLNLEVAVISPPFGILLYTMKGIAGEGTTMGDVIRASVPFMGLILLAMVLVIAFPMLALWLPGLMR